MSLYDTQLKNGKTDVDLNTFITAENGREWPAENVFIQALKYIKSQVFTYLKKNKLNISNIDDIQWILTVPAIWSERAKYKMEQWALKAELINSRIPNHLKIVYEPDCASLSIQYEIQQLKEIEMRKSELGMRQVHNRKRLSTFQINCVKKVKKKKKKKRRKKKKKIIDDQKSEEIEHELIFKEIQIQQEMVSEEIEVEKLDKNVNEVIEDDVDVDDDEMREKEESYHSQPPMMEELVVNDDYKDVNDDVSQNNPKNEEMNESEIKPIIDDPISDEDDEIILFSDDSDDEDDDDDDENIQENDDQIQDIHENVQNEENEQSDENVQEIEENLENDQIQENLEIDQNQENQEIDQNEENQEIEQKNEEINEDINKMNEDNKELEEDIVNESQIDEENKESSIIIENEQQSDIIEKQHIDHPPALQLITNDDLPIKQQPIESEDESSSYEEYTDDDTDEEEEDDDKINTHWLKGERYILMDAGGGTCDVACHEILGEYAVKEVVHPTGGAWGSTYIDDHFMQLLNKIFSVQWMKQFRSEDPSAFTELRENFRIAKQEFWKNEKSQENNEENKEMEEEQNNIDILLNKYKNKWHNMQLPFDFLSFLQERLENMDDEVQDLELETLVSHTNIHNHYNLIELEDEYLKLNYFIWTHELFDKVIDPILDHCRHLLCNTKMKDTTNYICIVGGLGSSKYLQHRITDEFGPLSKYKISIIVPSRPILTVVEGAARFGLQPDYIQSRTLAKTYGNAIDPKIDAIDVNSLPAGYLVSNQYTCDHTNIVRVRNIFSIYAKKNDDINIHAKPIVRKYKRFNVKQKKVRISVYTSDLEDPKVVVGRPLAKTTVVFPDESTELSIIVELFFSDTKIRVYAYPENEPMNRKEMELDYEFC